MSEYRARTGAGAGTRSSRCCGGTFLMQMNFMNFSATVLIATRTRHRLYSRYAPVAVHPGPLLYGGRHDIHRNLGLAFDSEEQTVAENTTLSYTTTRRTARSAESLVAGLRCS